MDWIVNTASSAWEKYPHGTLMVAILIVGLGSTALLKLTSRN